MTNKRTVFIRSLCAAILIAVLVISPVALTGCSLLRRSVFGESAIEFTKTSVSLEVGDTLDLTTVIKSNSSSYSLTVSDKSVVSIKGRTLTAVGAGTATVSAIIDLSTATLKVTVTEAAQPTLTVTPTGALVRTAGESTPLILTPSATGTLEKHSVVWQVDGEHISTKLYNESFEFSPTIAGKYTVTAKCGTVTCDTVVRVYNPVSIAASYSGELTQSAPFTPIVFSAEVGEDESNPAPYMEIISGGETLAALEGVEYTYKPVAGLRTVTVRVNGEDALTVDLNMKGAVTPAAPTVEFDNMYPHFYVCYNVVGRAAVQITSPDGQTNEYSQDDSRYSALFSDGRFDAGGMVDACASSSARRAYSFKVKSLGDGESVTESGYSAATNFTQLPSSAKKYIRTVIAGRDLYVTSEKEYAEVAEYYIVFRDKSGTTPVAVDFECYLAFEPSGSVTDLWNAAFPAAATSGSYTGIKVTRDENVMRTRFNVDTVNNPTRYAVTTLSSSSLPKQLHAVLPHINYDESKYRSDDHKFAIDFITRTETVEYSDELYLAVERGVRPVAKVGSSAAVIYERARDILAKICTDDMTDMQKAHAIYDWIMWQVTYDTPATKMQNGESYSAYYLEGVFGDGKLAIDGVKYPPYAVCDGMSKAYSLMCNIEGIPCVRVVGTAGKSLATAGGHAWNKVFVNGEWYIVDCTWGDTVGSLALDGTRKTDYELGLHDYLFLTDAETKDTHFEPYTVKTAVQVAPVTANRPYSVYKDMSVNGSPINCLVAKNENQLERTRQIATEFAKAYEKKSSIVVPGCPDNGVCEVGYQAIDIKYEQGRTLTDSNLEAAVSSAVRAVLRTATVKVVTANDLAIVLIKN